MTAHIKIPRKTPIKNKTNNKTKAQLFSFLPNLSLFISAKILVFVSCPEIGLEEVTNAKRHSEQLATGEQ
eukprot:GAHX01001187.1.p2 GENE.GAHX01001187.1~~GAHX01001187.1.p2  ORF type:complete len:70 (+),score=10.48 GAHX01001187.1:128-337(+)